jgi:tRNA threonylcarbamoyladenosine biosynthesis protein TsaB
VNILAIDTATTSLGLALRSASQARLSVLQAGLRHEETLLPEMERLLRDVGLTAADLQLVVCSTGPGSFTGIRIGLAAAKGIAFARKVPLLGVSTLEGLSYRYRFFPGTVVAVNPSLRGRRYAALYREGSRIDEYLELFPEQLAFHLESQDLLLITGGEAAALHALLRRRIPRARLILDASGSPTDPLGLLDSGLERYLKEGAPAAEPEPLYLRRSEAEIKASRRGKPPGE